MTHNTESLEEENFGSRKAYIHQINVTSLSEAGKEVYDPDTELNVNLGDDYGVHPVGQTNTSVAFVWDVSDENVTVTHRSDGTNVADNSSVGEVRLLVVGN